MTQVTIATSLKKKIICREKESTALGQFGADTLQVL
jgi:hypothetical protein